MQVGREQKIWTMFMTACLLITGSYGMTGCFAGQDNQTAQQRSQTTEQAVVSASADNPGEAAADGKETADTVSGEAADCLRLYLGKISGDLSVFHTETKGDERVLSLMYQRVSDVADIQVEKNLSEGHARYRITLKEQTTDAKGRLITADDLLYNYYLRCQITYQGQDAVNRIAIRGLSEYQYGAAGKKLRQMEQKVEKLLEAPGAALRREIQKEIILPALKQEYAWVESAYLDPECEEQCKKYPQPQQLFSHYYAVDTTYTGEGKTRGEVLQDVKRQYGTDTDKLSQVTGENYEKAEEALAIRWLWKELAAGSGKISGITKVDERTIEVETTNYRKKDIKRLGEIYLISEAEEGEVFPVGTGSYVFQEETGDQMLLRANSYCQRDSLNPVKIVIDREEQTGADCVWSICNGKLDMACIWERIAMEKEAITQALATGDASWRVAARGGVLYHTERVNGTTVAEEQTETGDVSELLRDLQMNE